MDRPRTLAFYLPQYHPIPENDRWWGTGFTEWTSVVRARPRFRGHHQPHLPADLGFYDLRLPEAREAQADLARAHGVDGFVYYHYWFYGRRLLGRPLDDVVATQHPDFPFALCWANENWTRVWDGGGDDVLMEQHYSAEDDVRHIEWLAHVFNDQRYVRVDGRPIFLVYRASALTDPLRTTDRDRTVTVSDGTEIAYTVVGEGERTPIVFVNGWTCSDAYWAGIGPGVVKAGHRALFLDTRGHGQSGLPRPPGPMARNLTDADV